MRKNEGSMTGAPRVGQRLARCLTGGTAGRHPVIGIVSASDDVDATGDIVTVGVRE